MKGRREENPIPVLHAFMLPSFFVNRLHVLFIFLCFVSTDTAAGIFFPRIVFDCAYLPRGTNYILPWHGKAVADFPLHSHGLPLCNRLKEGPQYVVTKKNKFTRPEGERDGMDAPKAGYAASTEVILPPKYSHTPLGKECMPETGGAFVAEEQAAQDTVVPLDEESVLPPGQTPEQKISGQLFIRIEANKTTCYVGEGIQVTYKLYSRLHASSEVIKRPSFPGCSVVDMLSSYDADPTIEWVNDRAFYVHIIRKVHAFPLREGSLPLDEAVIESVVHFNREVRTDDTLALKPAPLHPFDYQTTLRSPPFQLTVKPLPPYKGSTTTSLPVGDFSMRLSADKFAYHPGELIQLSLTIRGHGNWTMIGPPAINALSMQEPEVQENFNPAVYPLYGEKIFLYRFIATDTTLSAIPSTSMLFFNPEKKEFLRTHTKALALNIRTGIPIQKDAASTPQQKATHAFEGPLYIYIGVLVIAVVAWIIFLLLKNR